MTLPPGNTEGLPSLGPTADHTLPIPPFLLHKESCKEEHGFALKGNSSPNQCSSTFAEKPQLF